MFLRLACRMLLAISLGCGSTSPNGSSSSDVAAGNDTVKNNAANSASDTEPVGDLGKVFGNPSAIEVINNAESVNAFRLPSPSYYQASLADYEMSAGPVELSDELVSKLRVVLLDTSTYGWDFAKGCNPDYGVRIQFRHGSEEVDVLLCFECNLLSVYKNGYAVGGEDFDDGRPQLVEIVKSLFPSDEVIQALKAES